MDASTEFHDLFMFGLPGRIQYEWADLNQFLLVRIVSNQTEVNSSNNLLRIIFGHLQIEASNHMAGCRSAHPNSVAIALKKSLKLRIFKSRTKNNLEAARSHLQGLLGFSIQTNLDLHTTA